MRFRTNLKIKSGLADPAPFLDVFIQIVVFFILVTQFLGHPGLMLELPKATLPALFKDTTVKISISSDGISFKGNLITIEELKDTLDKELISMLVIEADKEVPYSRIVEVIDLTKQMGIDQIAIAVDEINNR